MTKMLVVVVFFIFLHHKYCNIDNLYIPHNSPDLLDENQLLLFPMSSI